MPEDNNQDNLNREGDGGQQGTSSKQPGTLEDALKYISALEKRIGERSDESKKRGDELQQLRDELKELQDFRQKSLEQQGQYQTIAEERAKKITELQREAELRKKYEALVQNQVDSALAQLPEDSRDLLPEGLTLDQQLTLLNKLVPKLTRPPAPDYDAGAGGFSGGVRLPTLTAYEKEIAAASGMSEKEYAEFKAKQGQAITLNKKDEK